MTRLTSANARLRKCVPFLGTFCVSLAAFLLFTRGHFELGKDAAYFYSTASSLWRDGRFVVEAFVTTHAGRFGILYPLLLAPLFSLAEWRDRIEWIYLLQAGLFACTLALIDLRIRRLGLHTLPRVLLLTALLTHLPLLHIFTELSVEVVVLPVFALLLHLLALRRTPPPLLVLALLSSAMILARPASVALLAPLALLYWQRDPVVKKVLLWLGSSLVLPALVQWFRSTGGSTLLHFQIVEWRIQLMPVGQLGDVLAAAFFPGPAFVAYPALGLVLLLVGVGATKPGTGRRLSLLLGVYVFLLYLLCSATLSLADHRLYWQPRYAIFLSLGIAAALALIEKAPFRQLGLALLALSSAMNLYVLATSATLGTDYRSQFLEKAWERDPCYNQLADLSGKLVYSNDIELLYVLSDSRIRFQRYIPGLFFNDSGVYRKRESTPRYAAMFGNLAREGGRLVHLAREANYTQIPDFGDASYQLALAQAGVREVLECGGSLIRIYRIERSLR